MVLRPDYILGPKFNLSDLTALCDLGWTQGQAKTTAKLFSVSVPSYNAVALASYVRV